MQQNQPLYLIGCDIHMVLLLGLILIVAIEYIGLGHYIPGANRIPLILSLSIFVIAIATNFKGSLLKHTQIKAFSIFLMLTTLSLFHAFVTFQAFQVFKAQVGYLILCISLYLIIKNSRHILFLMGSMVFFHCFIVIVNLDRLNQGQRTGSFIAGYFLGDGNDFAWSLVTFLPFALYFLSAKPKLLIRLPALAALAIFVLGIVGTGSRGAFLAAVASLLYLVINSRNKAFSFTCLGFLALVAVSLAPPAYIDRVESISAYEEDSSALGRLVAWKAAFQMALDHPLGVGAGNFSSAYGRYYMPENPDTRIYANRRWIAPHSIYFLTLGEYGFFGLFIILLLLYSNYRDNRTQIRLFQPLGKEDIHKNPMILLPKYLNMSLVAFAAGGVFLGGLNYPHIFILTALILRTKEINRDLVDEQQAQLEKTTGG